MAKNDFTVTYFFFFKIILRIFKIIFEYCRKISKFLAQICLFVLCIFYLNEDELIQEKCLRKYIENEIFNSTSHKTKNKRRGAKI